MLANLLITWLLLPFAVAFLAALQPRLARGLSLLASASILALAAHVLVTLVQQALSLLSHA